ncbi:MAG: Ribosomal protein [Candidatus Taylorbacteria bacterium]|nr:Ribosomal protein [Candidatus Taylorbacteria bacterium]
MKEYTNKTAAELAKLVAEKRESLRSFRFGNAGSKSKNVKEGRTLRKDIARILTAVGGLKSETK